MHLNGLSPLSSFVLRMFLKFKITFKHLFHGEGGDDNLEFFNINQIISDMYHNTGLKIISFHSTAHWHRDCYIIQMGGNMVKYLGNFSWREIPIIGIKYFICLEYNKF